MSRRHVTTRHRLSSGPALNLSADITVPLLLLLQESERHRNSRLFQGGLQLQRSVPELL